MAYRRSRYDFSTFPTPARGYDVIRSQRYRDCHSHPYYELGFEGRVRRSRYAAEYCVDNDGWELRDRSLEREGDLGWTLDYATAWCYRFLIGNQTEVADILDKIRSRPVVNPKTPYEIFNFLDRALFGAKLKNMVYLRWDHQTSSACGRTSAPRVVPGIMRICIELNSLPFERCTRHIDGLLDPLIHQMIHAFFLVCCGAQPKSAKQDGRLADGLHFGVILHTIQDISRQCTEGALRLIFYATDRRRVQNKYSTSPCANAYGYGFRNAVGLDDRLSWISVDPQGSMVPAAPADGQSHCSHDNRSIREAQVKNWQVQHYSRAIDLNMEMKGDVIYRFNQYKRLVRRDRLTERPSTTYAELIWGEKRIMVPKEQAESFPSIMQPLMKDGKHELQLRDCDGSVVRYVWDFLQHGRYQGEEREMGRGLATGQTRGPPVLSDVGVVQRNPRFVGQLRSDGLRVVDCPLMVDHIAVFKAAEDVKFEELQRYALGRLYGMSTTREDPIEALKELYNEGKDSGKPIHAELHKWARNFLARRDDQISHYDYGTPTGYDTFESGVSNFEKLQDTYGDRFQELYHRNLAFKDDCMLVRALLSARGMINHVQPDTPWSSPCAIMSPQQRNSRQRVALPRRRSVPDCRLLDPLWTEPASDPLSIFRGSLEDMFDGRPYTREYI